MQVSSPAGGSGAAAAASWAVVASPADLQRFYAGVFGQGVDRSTNRGDRWAAMDTERIHPWPWLGRGHEAVATTPSELL